LTNRKCERKKEEKERKGGMEGRNDGGDGFKRVEERGY